MSGRRRIMMMAATSVSNVPDNCLLYLPLTEEAATAKTGQRLIGGGRIAYGSINGRSGAKMNSSPIGVEGFVSGTSSFVLSVWICSTGSGGNQTICSNDGNVWRLGRLGSGLIEATYATGVQYRGASVSVNVWHHVVMMRDGDSLRTYLDGVKDMDIEQSTATASQVSGFWVGAWGSGGGKDRYKEYISHLRFYDFALGEDDIAALAAETWEA